MKILISSKRFGRHLKRIDLTSVKDVSIDKNKYLTINYGRGESITIPVESQDDPVTIIQSGVRYDWLSKDLCSIQEQPVVIEFLDNTARFNLSY